MFMKWRARLVSYAWLLSISASLGFIEVVSASGHLDSPKLTLDPGADISAVYAFRSWQDSEKLIVIMNVVPSQHPGDAPMYHIFDDTVLHRIHIDNDRDGRANDVVFDIRFTTTTKAALDEFYFIQSYLGHPDIPLPELQGITSLVGPNSEGITVKQTYNVFETRGKRRSKKLFKGTKLVAVPPNVGSQTMPDYEALSAQGIYSDSGSKIRVFAGQRAETFYADINGLFDTGNLRGFPPLLSEEQDLDDTINPYGINRYRATNVNTIALEIPISYVTKDGKSADDTNNPHIGVYASTHRRQISILRDNGKPAKQIGRYMQIDRMGNPMVSLFFMDTSIKNEFSTSRPENDAQFLEFFLNPNPPRYPTTPYVFKIPSPPPPRWELVDMFLKYPGQTHSGNKCGHPCADLLRLDLSVAPTEPEEQSRLGSFLGNDPAGVPNGLRPNDDTLDFIVRTIGGPMPIALRISDGVNFADGIPGAGESDGPGYGTVVGNKLDTTENGIVKEFPFMPTAHNGHSPNQ